MTQTVAAMALLPLYPGVAGIGYRILNLDGTTYSGFTTTNVVNDPVGGIVYRVTNGVAAPDAGGYIIWGISGADYGGGEIPPASAGGGSAPTVTQIRQEIDANSTQLAAIKAKTDNLPAAPAAVSDIPTANDINTALSTAHGAGSWATATGFATPTDVTNAQTAIAAAIAALHNLSTGDIDARLAAYDGATQADLDTAKAAVLVAIAALNNLSQAQAQTAATAALNAYDGPTKAELDAAQAAIQTDIAGIEGGGGGGSTAADIWTYPDRTLTRFGSMTGVAFTYTVTSTATGLPISGVTVWFATDNAGTNIVWSGVTDTFGAARDAYGALPKLDVGTYYVFRARPGYIFANPDTEVVN